MNMAGFVRRNRDRWQRLEDLLNHLHKRRVLKGLNRATLRELSTLYRACTSDLAFAQTHFPGTSVLQFLHQLVGRAHHQIYRTKPITLPGIWRFFHTEVPQAARENLWAITLAAIIFLMSFSLGLAAAESDPGVATLVLPAGVIEDIYAGEMWTRDIFSVTPAALSSALLFTNNITVAFLCFAGGMTLGIFTFYILLLNGFMLGVVFKLCAQHGLLWDLFVFIASHGFVELSVIIVAGASGFVLARALLDPGDYSRADALSLRGHSAIRLALGGVPPLIVMGFIEALVSPSEAIPAWFKIILGLVLLGAYLSYLLGGRKAPTLQTVVSDAKLLGQKV